MSHKIVTLVTAFAVAFSLTAKASAQDTSADPGVKQDEKKEEPRSPWLYSGDIGVPKLESGATKLIGDGTLGYAKERWGIQGGLAFASYATSSQQAFSSTSRSSGGVDVWWRTGQTDDRLRYELRGELGYASYATMYIMTGDAAAAGTSAFSTETSGMTRATALGGARYRHSTTLDGFVLVGLGYQGESYSTASEAGADVSMSSTARYTARLGGAWAVMPDKVVLRVRSDIGYYSITRTRLAVDSTTSTTGEPLTRTSFKQLEMNNRLFGDLPMFAFAGLTPTLFVGLDVMSISGDAGSAKTLVPLGGIGFVSASM